MLTVAELQSLAEARLADAEVLFANQRTDGAVYLCGYAIEVRLKARICITLGWPGFPSSKKDFESLTSFRTHDLDILLLLSGVETRIKSNHMAEWSIVTLWTPEARYKPLGSVTPADAKRMIDATRSLLKEL